MSKLQSENAKLKVLTNQKEKEILHLRDPDKDMVHKIRILSDEVTMLRTQTRRLNEEKVSFLVRHYLIVHLVSMVQGREHRRVIFLDKSNIWKFAFEDVSNVA